MRTASIPIAVLLLLAVPAAAQFGLWCENADAVRVEIDGATVTVVHEAALYNCCPDPFRYDASWEGNRLVVTETEVLTHPCYCVCCFDLSTTVENVPPGDWIARFRWYDYEDDDWRQVELPFSVGDTGQSGPVFVGASDDSGCQSSSSVDPSSPPAIGWGCVKAIYR